MTANGRDVVVERLGLLTNNWASERAIEFDDHWFTWGDVGTVADAIESIVEQHSFGSPSSIVIVMAQRPSTVIAELAVLRAGRTAVLISPLQGDAALADEIRLIRPGVIVLDVGDFERSGVHEAIASVGALGIELGESLTPRVRLAPPRRSMPGAGDTTASSVTGVTAVTVLTSGTTGPPQRLPVSWADFVALGGGTQHVHRPPRPGHGALIVSVPIVTLGGLLAISRLVFGGRPMSLMERFDVNTWAGLVKRHRPKVIGAPPPVVKMILDADITPDHFEGVGAFVTSSAAIPPEVIDRFRQTYGFPVLLSYGATEFLGSVTQWSAELWEQFGSEKVGSVGRAKPGVRLRVVDPETGEPVEHGAPGVLEVDSPLRAGGLPEGWLRTSDRARIDTDGFVWILGRTDDVIVRGGFKVDLNDVEAVARQHADVPDACAVGLDDSRLGSVPALAVTGEVDADEMIDHLRRELPPYAVPVAVRVVESIPVTSTLKHDRGAVRAMFTDDMWASE